MKHISEAYSPEKFRQSGHQLIDLLADYLQKAISGDPMTVLPWQEYAEAYDNWSRDFEKSPNKDIDAFFEKVLRESIVIHHPNYMGHQISPAAPMGALAGLLSDFLNNGMGVFEMGVVGSTLDRVVIHSVAKQMGFDSMADGVMTSGGTLANVTALLTARSIKASDPVWEKGTQKQFALMVSAQAHYCVDRAARIMGWGEKGIIKVPCDDNFQMRTELLPQYLEEAQAQGIEVLAVVGSACSTSTGSYDNLDAIADFCEQHNLWFHIDGAHGAAAIYSQKYRHLVKGIERADSVIMDFHKMLLTPAITTALVFKNGKLNFKTFAQEAQYLFEEQEGLDWFNMAKRTFECTKTMMSLKIYILLRTYGPQLFDEYVTKVIDLSRTFVEMVRKHPAFELAHDPKCNIVCFRHLGVANLSKENLNVHNESIRRLLKENGDYYIVKTILNGATYLRCTFTNPFTEEVHLEGLLECLEELAMVKENA